MNVMSLFDGISIAQQALRDLKIIPENYYSSEIDKFATSITKKNFPNTKFLGDVRNIDGNQYNGKITLLIGGSPCQDLSVANKNRKGLAGERSGLFFEYARILREVKPKFFILENVFSMPKEARAKITKELYDIEPIMINASLVSAQNRKRLFWVGKLVGEKYQQVKIELPEDMGILLKDILQPNSEVDERMIINGKSYTITANYGGAVAWNSIEKKQRTMVRVCQLGNGSQGYRVYSPDGKAVSLCANGGGGGAKTGIYHIPHGYNRGKVEEAEKYPTLHAQDPANNHILLPDIRKLTPIECERLQSVPDNYTEGISNTQRYKVLGNAFNCNVIQHIMKSISDDLAEAL